MLNFRLLVGGSGGKEAKNIHSQYYGRSRLNSSRLPSDVNSCGVAIPCLLSWTLFATNNTKKRLSPSYVIREFLPSERVTQEVKLFYVESSAPSL